MVKRPKAPKAPKRPRARLTKELWIWQLCQSYSKVLSGSKSTIQALQVLYGSIQNGELALAEDDFKALMLDLSEQEDSIERLQRWLRRARKALNVPAHTSRRIDPKIARLMDFPVKGIH